MVHTVYSLISLTMYIFQTQSLYKKTANKQIQQPTFKHCHRHECEIYIVSSFYISTRLDRTLSRSRYTYMWFHQPPLTPTVKTMHGKVEALYSVTIIDTASIWLCANSADILVCKMYICSPCLTKTDLSLNTCNNEPPVSVSVSNSGRWEIPIDMKSIKGKYF